MAVFFFRCVFDYLLNEYAWKTLLRVIAFVLVKKKKKKIFKINVPDNNNDNNNITNYYCLYSLLCFEDFEYLADSYPEEIIR